METKPSEVKVGQRWRFLAYEPETIDTILAGGRWRCRANIAWGLKELLTNPDWRYLGPAETPPVPAGWAVGQKRQTRVGPTPAEFTVLRRTGNKEYEWWVRWNTGPYAGEEKEFAERWGGVLLDTQEPKATKESAAPSTPVMGERCGRPVACLVCGGAKEGGLFCEPCWQSVGKHDEGTRLYEAWHAGDRAFPRREAKPATVPESVPCPRCRRLACACTSPQTVPSVSKPTRREVSTDGKHWVNFDRLTDGDAFEAYPWTREVRENGTLASFHEPLEPRGWDGSTFAAHVEQDKARRESTDWAEAGRTPRAATNGSEQPKVSHGLTGISRSYWPRSLPDMDVSK